MTMPSGAYVKADFVRGLANSVLNIYVHLNSEDRGKTSGLCGVWNGNPGDDTVPKGATKNDGRDHPNTFSESYRYTVLVHSKKCAMAFRNNICYIIHKCPAYPEYRMVITSL